MPLGGENKVSPMDTTRTSDKMKESKPTTPMGHNRFRSISSPPPPTAALLEKEGKKLPTLPRLDTNSTPIVVVDKVEGNVKEESTGPSALRSRKSASFYHPESNRQGSFYSSSNRSSKAGLFSAPISPGVSPTSPMFMRPLFASNTTSTPSAGAITLAEFKYRDIHPRKHRLLLHALQTNETARRLREGVNSMRSRKGNPMTMYECLDSNGRRDKGSTKIALSKLNALLKQSILHLLTLAIHDNRSTVSCALIEDLTPSSLKKKRPAEANRCLLLSMAHGMENVANIMIEKGFPPNVNAGIFGTAPLAKEAPQKASRFSAGSNKDPGGIPPPSPALAAVAFPSYFMLAVGIGLENLTKSMAKRANVNQGWYGLTPLHIACCKGNANIVNSLLENGAEISTGLPLDDYLVLSRLKSEAARNVTKEFGASKGQWRSAEEKKEAKAKEESIESKKKKKKWSHHIPEDYVHSRKISPVELAAACGHVDLVKYLLSRMETKVISNLQFCFLIHHSYEMTCYFIRAGANPDTQKDPWGSSCLHLAARNGWTELVVTYIQCKLNINAKGENDWTPLHEAVSQKQKAIAQYLIRQGAQVEALSTQNETPKQVGKRVGIPDAELQDYFEPKLDAIQDEATILENIKKFLTPDPNANRSQSSPEQKLSLMYKKKKGFLQNNESSDSIQDNKLAPPTEISHSPPKVLSKTGSDLFFKSMFNRNKDKNKKEMQTSD